LAGLSPWFLFGLGAAAVQLAWQAATVRIGEPADCLAKFKSNLWFGLLIFAGIAAGRALPFPG
jgi:4-hydroxybenzoate polyprenyltransferase